MKILAIFGTRPEAIKMAPVIRELRRRAGDIGCEPAVCVTGQHRHMLDQVLHLFGIHPDYDLNVMQEDQSPASVAAGVLMRLEQVLQSEHPDWVLVQGDTTTAMAAALAAFFQRARVAHVEAGLRTWNKAHPFPEEINRKLADAISDLHLAPTETSRQNLLREGVDDRTIRVTGNTVIDALHWVVAQPFDLKTLGLAALADPSTRWILVTAHRRENLGRPLENICEALREIAARYRGAVQIVYPVHLNPNVEKPVRHLLEGVPHIHLLPPLDYMPLVHLMQRAYLVLTDSGGIQEEAPGLGKPVLVLREVTERPEAVAAGTVKVVGTDCERIVAETIKLLDDRSAFEQMARAINPYGDGHAAERIVNAILETTL